MPYHVGFAISVARTVLNDSFSCVSILFSYCRRVMPGSQSPGHRLRRSSNSTLQVVTFTYLLRSLPTSRQATVVERHGVPVRDQRARSLVQGIGDTEQVRLARVSGMPSTAGKGTDHDDLFH